MGKVIRIDEYRRHDAAGPDADRDVWSCGVCGESGWTVTTSGHLRCRHCDTTAANLRLADVSPARHPAPDHGARPPWNPLLAPGQWWWTWARQS